MSGVPERRFGQILEGIVILALCVPLAIVGWLFVSTLIEGSSEGLDGGPSDRTYESPEPEPEPVRGAEPVHLWVCRHSPTINDDWHDDVVCTNGQQKHRPYLRAGDAFITPFELIEAAAAYEAELNSGP